MDTVDELEPDMVVDVVDVVDVVVYRVESAFDERY
jgi:hypothetical protein